MGLPILPSLLGHAQRRQQFHLFFSSPQLHRNSFVGQMIGHCSSKGACGDEDRLESCLFRVGLERQKVNDINATQQFGRISFLDRCRHAPNVPPEKNGLRQEPQLSEPGRLGALGHASERALPRAPSVAVSDRWARWARACSWRHKAGLRMKEVENHPSFG